MKEQNKYDQIPASLFDRVQRILPLVNQVANLYNTADEVVCEETDILENLIPRMFEVMHRVAKFACDYVRRSRWFIFCISQVLITAARTVGGLDYRERIKELDGELTKVIEDFDRAMNFEALRQIKETGKSPLSRYFMLSSCPEQKLLLKRFKHIDTGYNTRLRCMEGTRNSLLNQIIAWATDRSTRKDGGNMFWIYGLPGIGKTALAHSIYKILHERKHLAGAFFCRRNDPNLDKPGIVLPTLIYHLTITFPTFRSVVAAHLRNNLNTAPESMDDTLLSDLISSLPRHPKRNLVFIIDAFDECGDARSRPYILKALTEVGAQAPWLRIIITSRPEVDIQRFFATPTLSSHFQFDLATDQEASADLRIFAQQEFKLVALNWHLAAPWPETSLFDRVISHANGLFIFIKTLVLALDNCADPTKSLETALHGSSGAGVTSLYELYSNILRVRVSHSCTEFQRTIGVLLATASYRALCEETIAELAGVNQNLVKKWVDGLSSMLYRDEGANGVIRVRHLSISDFFLSNECPRDYHVDLQDANTQLGIACLTTMLDQLRFNICNLEDSRLANADVKDLQSRIRQNISDALQYSCLYWSNHLCSNPKNDNEHVWECLRELFEGLGSVFWIEVLSLMGMVPMSIPSLRRVISTWVKVSTIPGCCLLVLQGYSNISLYRAPICYFRRELQIFAVSSPPSGSPSPKALRTSIFQRDHSYPYNLPC